MKINTLWIQQQDGDGIPHLPLQALQQHGGDLQIGGLHQAGVSIEHSQVGFFFQQGVSFTGNSGSLVSDGGCRQYTAQDMFAHTHMFLVCVAQGSRLKT